MACSAHAPQSLPVPFQQKLTKHPSRSYNNSINQFSGSCLLPKPLNPDLLSLLKPLQSSLHTLTPIPAHKPTNEGLLQICLHGKLKPAMEYLASMRREQALVKEESFIALARLCEFRRGRKEGRYVYEFVLESLTSPLSLGLGNALLSMFVRFGDVGSAWNVFGRMGDRNLFSWNVLIGGYSKGGFFDEALCLYHRMLWIGIRPDVYTFPCILRSCGGAQDIVRARELHAHVIRFGFELQVDIVNALITMYVKCRDVELASKLFDNMLIRDTISWNAMISGFFENGECLRGFKLFFKMRELSINPDLMTITSVISACALLADDRFGRQVHGYVMRTDFADDVSVSNSLIEFYSRVGNWKEAEEKFSGMKSRDVVTWTAMISCYQDNLLSHKALETFMSMEMEGIEVDEMTIASVLSACASLQNLDMGVKLHELAIRTGLISYTLVANSLIDMYSKCACTDKALEVFHQISQKEVISWTSIIDGLRINKQWIEALLFFSLMISTTKPNSVTLISALSACARIGALMCGKEIHAHVIKTGVGFDGFLPNAILDMYVRCGRMRAALYQFDLIKKDVGAWNILLRGYARRGQGSWAMELFRRMLDAQVVPDQITFISLLCACSRSGMVTAGLELFKSMKFKHSITPTLKHYACVVDLLGRDGQLEEAYDFIMNMPIKPDQAVWGALLNGCRIHRNVKVGELAAHKVFELGPDRIGYYVLLCNLYSDTCKWDQVVEVRERMKKAGLVLDPGCSWIEAKGKVHAFLTADKCSHPQAKEMNVVLEGFYEKMKEAGGNDEECSCTDVVEKSKADMFCGHSERRAIAFGLISTAPGVPIWVTKNLYMCRSCHSLVKFISKVVRRDISVRDTEGFHHFKDGVCSCGDEGYREEICKSS
ncbi:Pentatricopeptide repeat-containing protein At1g15510, chloroplastic [Linum grandiflorum]